MPSLQTYPGPKRSARTWEGFKLRRYLSIQLRLLDVFLDLDTLMYILPNITCIHFSSIHISTLLFIKLLIFTFRVCHSLFSVVLTVCVNIRWTKDWTLSLLVSKGMNIETNGSTVRTPKLYLRLLS
jgi:hypothetical protein